MMHHILSKELPHSQTCNWSVWIAGWQRSSTNCCKQTHRAPRWWHMIYTTFQLGNFYVSPLLFRHTLLNGSPVMPLGFLIHEWKFQETHEFFQQVKKEVTYFRSKKKTSILLVIDDESALYEAAEGVLDNIPPLQCWDHLINSLKMWLRQQQTHRKSHCCCSRYSAYLRYDS